MPLDDITLRALAHTEQSMENAVKKIQLNRTIEEANQFAQQIKSSDLGEKEQRTALEDISQQASLRLTQAGVPRTDIGTVMQGILPVDPLIQSLDQALISNDPRVRERGMDALQLKQNQALQQALLKSRLNPAIGPKEMLSQVDRFKKSPTIKNYTEAINNLDKVDAMLAQGTVPSKELAKIALVKGAGESGRLSDADLERANFEVSTIRKIQAWAARVTAGGALPETLEDMKLFAKGIRAHTLGQLRKAAVEDARVAASITGESEDRMRDLYLRSVGIKPLRERLVKQRKRNARTGEIVEVLVDPADNNRTYRGR